MCPRCFELEILKVPRISQRCPGDPLGKTKAVKGGDGGGVTAMQETFSHPPSDRRKHTRREDSLEEEEEVESAF